MEPEPVKPGYLTTEFWLTIAGQAVAILVLLGVIGSGEEATVKNAVAEAIKNSAALVSAAVILWKYFQSRAHIKSAASVEKTSSNNLKLAALGANASRLHS